MSLATHVSYDTFIIVEAYCFDGRYYSVYSEESELSAYVPVFGPKRWKSNDSIITDESSDVFAQLFAISVYP